MGGRGQESPVPAPVLRAARGADVGRCAASALHGGGLRGTDSGAAPSGAAAHLQASPGGTRFLGSVVQTSSEVDNLCL